MSASASPPGDTTTGASLVVQFGRARVVAVVTVDDVAFAAVGGSWIAPSELIRRREWETIRGRAAAAVALAGETFPSI